jgi:sugar/nucleoside kinase (ribokinase family)
MAGDEGKAAVGCVGILVADTICGPLEALPGPGELLAIDDMPMSAGGCAANVAIDLARQGLAVDVVGCLGADAAAEIVVAELQRANVGCARIVRSYEASTSKTVILLVAGEDRRYIHNFGANAAFRVSDIDRAWVKSLAVLYVGGLYAMPGIDARELASLLAECRSAGVTTVVDVVVPRQARSMTSLDYLLPHIDYFLPNIDEAHAFTGLRDPFDQIAALQSKGAHTVIVTGGAAGSSAGDGTGRWQAGAYRLDTVDPSGSGDAFAAGVITGIVRGWPVPDMLRFGAALGASAARAIGTTAGVFRSDEAAAFVAAHPFEVKELAWK